MGVAMVLVIAVLLAPVVGSCGRGAHLVHNCLMFSKRYVCLIENSRNKFVLGETWTHDLHISNNSLELVHLTTTPLMHIFVYRIEMQCSGTFTLGFLVGYNYLAFSSAPRWWSPLWFAGALLHSAPELSPALHGSPEGLASSVIVCI